MYNFNIVDEEPPAPAARVLFGRSLAALSFWSAAARRRIAVAGPPGARDEEEVIPPLDWRRWAVGGEVTASSED